MVRRLERAAVRGLARMLPTGFRDRQRAEWTGDLLALADRGTGQRWRYLLAAALTLPALRTAAQRGGLSQLDGPAVVASAPAVMTALARVLGFGLGVPIVGWIVTVPVRYFLFKPPGYGDPKDVWPHGWLFVALLPLIVVLTVGAYIVVFGGPALIGALGLAAVVVGLTQRHENALHRALVSLSGVGLLTVMMAAFATGVGLSTDDTGRAQDGVLFALGILTVIVGLHASGLACRTRIAVTAVGFAAIAVTVASGTATGIVMLGWFLD